MSRITLSGKRPGKSYLMAIRVASEIKKGNNVYIVSKGSLEKVVCVPGHDDGKQLTAPKE